MFVQRLVVCEGFDFDMERLYVNRSQLPGVTDDHYDRILLLISK